MKQLAQGERICRVIRHTAKTGAPGSAFLLTPIANCNIIIAVCNRGRDTVKFSLRVAALPAIVLPSLGLIPMARAAVDGQWVIAAPEGPGGILLELKSDG